MASDAKVPGGNKIPGAKTNPDAKLSGTKILPIKGAEAASVDRARLARLPAPVHAIQERGKQLFSRLLRSLFDNADDALFALADKATSNHDQNLYFESMREVRISRRELERKFAEAIDEGFIHLVAKEGSAEPDLYARDRAETNKLSLVGDEELEELVAIESMVAKANKICGENLQYLSLRLDSLVPNKVYQKSNPLGPDLVCAAFVRAVRSLDADVKAKLVLFKLFEQYVVGELPPIYDALNETLIEHNVLPSLQHRKADGGPGERESSQTAGGQPAGTQTQINVYVSGSDLLGALSLLQGGALQPGASDDAGQLTGQGAAVTVESVRTDLGALLLNVLKEKHGERSLSQSQLETINLVKLLFDFVLDDRNLADPMKALIGRLQIPILKVALLDDSFFNKRGHPARRLLNEMATASLGWQEGARDTGRARDPLYRKIDEVVQRLLRDFETDLELFNDVLADFVSFIERERKRASIVERRTIDAEDGKARAEAAREQVNTAIAQIVAEQSMPASVRNILDNAWSNVLFLICLKQGRDSEEWQRALQTAEDLVWSVTVEPSSESRQKLLGMIPHLVKRLREGLERISFNPFEMTQLLNRLEKLHLARLQPGSTDPEENVVGLAIEEEAYSQPLIEEPEILAAEGAKDPSHTAQEGIESTSEEDLAKVDKLTQGAWFEMIESSDESYRCRLAAIIRPTGKYIFVNRSGMKVAEQSREDLALALKQNRIKPLDDSMLFERALESVIGGSRKSD